MLGRKTGTLGRVIDGEKNLSMNAQVAKDGDSTQTGGQSGQDELQSFFAETSPKDTTSPGKTVPTTGTIMSFFQKQKDSAKTTGIISNNATDGPRKSLFAAKTQAKVEWACDTCTFHNSRARPKSGWLQCSMCGTNYVEDPGYSPTVTPPSTRKQASLKAKAISHSDRFQHTSTGKTSSQHDLIVLDDCSDSDGKGTNFEVKTLSNSNQQHKASTKSSQEDPIVLDEDDGSYRPARRKRKSELIASEVLVLEDAEIPAKVGVVCDNQAPPSRLTFGVSKNSGRVTIHYSDTGESSVTNFEIDQVVSEATANQLMEAKTNRGFVFSQRGASKLDFSVRAIDQGEFSETFVSSRLH